MFKRRERSERKKRQTIKGWANVGMPLTFRAEVMPGRDADERTYIVARVLSSGRVELAGLVGQHTATEFEPVR